MLPNFAYIYGGFKCSGPILNDNNKVVDWCVNNNYSVNYILYENYQYFTGFLISILI